MRTRYKVLLALVVVFVSFAAGRYTTPVKVVTQTKTVTVEAKSSTTDTTSNKNEVITQHEVIQPDGTKVIDTITRDDVAKQMDAVSSVNLSSETESSKSVTKDGKKLNLSLLAGENVTSLGSPVFGGHVSTNLIGPITVGIFGLSNGVAGCSVGLEF